MTWPPKVRLSKIWALLIPLALVGCAAHYTPNAVQDPYGFFSGIWHGMIFPWALFANIISWVFGLFGISLMDSIQLIGRPNTGFFFYYVGFMMGLAAYSGGFR